MSRRFYSEINLHITWHTKLSAPLLTAEVEKLVRRSLCDRIYKTAGVIFHEIGGIETHIHLAVTVPPTLLISEWIGQLKGGSAYDVNQVFVARPERFAWQEGYGVVSFGTRQLKWIIEYIIHQKEHHAQNSTTDELERATAKEQLIPDPFYKVLLCTEGPG